MTMKQKLCMTTAAIAAATLLSVAVPAANAVENHTKADSSSIVSSRTFPRVNTVKKDFLAESTATKVDDNTNWGGIESLNIPQTKSEAEKQAEAEAKQREEAAAQQQRDAAAAQQEAAAASRDQQRESLSSNAQAAPQPSVSVPSSKTGAAAAQLAIAHVGTPYVWGGASPSGWDCSGMVMWVYSQLGVSLPHSSSAMMGVGTAVPSLAQAQPGDILANASHAAIYIGNGMVVNALNPAQGTQITDTSVFSGGYAIRRVL